MFKVIENKNIKLLKSEDYNYIFNKNDGFFARWGKTEDEDPDMSPVGPEILDIEVSTICNAGCSYCYKSNTSKGYNMSLNTFQEVLNKVNENNQLTQLAFGLGATGEENPDLWKMCEYSRSKGVIPNGTVANITDETADKIANLFGACAVSYHGNKDNCYNSVEKLTSRGMKQVNIHYVIHSGNVKETLEVLSDIKTDPRLSKLNAIVLLSLKEKGRAKNKFKQLSQEDFNSIVDFAIKSNVPFGMDSCTGPKYLEYINKHPELESHKVFVEPCESSIFSSYCDVFGNYHPCSFCEESSTWSTGQSILKCDSFINDIWNGSRCSTWRENLLKNNRNCPEYKI